MQKKIAILSLFLGIYIGMDINTFAQNADFVQNFSNPLFLNPAYAGSLGCSRVAANYRNKWTSFPGNYFSYGASYDQYVDKLSGGVGVQFISDNSDAGTITTNIINGIYAYNLRLNENLSIRPAFNIGIGQTRINWSKIDSFGVSSNLYFNAGAGLLLAYKNFIVGVSYDHINRPDVSFYWNWTSRLPTKLAVHCNYQFDINENMFLMPNIIFTKQQDFENIVYDLMLKVKHIKSGAGFRQGFENPDCAIFMLGYCNDWMSIGYSYDITVSKLSNATGGSHEISAVFKFNCKNDKEKFKITQLYGF